MNTLFVLLYLATGVAACWEARRKGYGWWLGFLASFVFGPIALVAFVLLPMRALASGEVVRMASPVALDNGRAIPRGHVTVVRDSRSLGNEVVCQVSAPDASLHWVSQRALSRTGATG